MIRWAFLDVGNVLLDEDPLTFRNFRSHVDSVRAVRPDLGFAGLLAEREARVAAGSRWPLHEVVSRYLDEAGCSEAWRASGREIRARYDELSPPIDGAEDLLRALAPRFRLGLIANQGAECRRTLARLGWLDRFEVVALSEEQGASKPDPALFERALALAEVAPGEAVMVGDRLDNDIAPAAALGMATAWVRWPKRDAKGWSPADPDAVAYLRSLARAGPAAVDQAPTWAVDDLRALIPGLLALA